MEQVILGMLLHAEGGERGGGERERKRVCALVLIDIVNNIFVSL